MKSYFQKLNRIDANCSLVENSFGLDVRLFANEDVAIDHQAFKELMEFLDVYRALADLKNIKSDLVGEDADITRVVLTPDFHKGSGIPIGTVVDARGFVIPGAIGNDICCGMRLLVTDLPYSKLEPHWKSIQENLRSIFFQGKRDIPMSPRQREAVLKYGLPGLLDTIEDNKNTGIYSHYDYHSQLNDLGLVFNSGGFNTETVFGFDKFIESSGNIDGRDPQIGCVGGGNHFCEVQKIEEIFCGETARQFGLTKNNVAIMIHSGSVGLGHAVGGYFADKARELFPSTISYPKNDFFILPMTGKYRNDGEFYMNSMYNAANFAFANRLFLGLMVIKAIEQIIGETISSKLVYDAPHNLVFDKGNNRYLHRKGATPAEGPANVYDWIGKPVIIPGSMGSDSYLLTGNGNDEALESACHGAGRIISRGEASHTDDKIFDKQTEGLKIVTPIDYNSPQMQMRKDIMEKYKMRIKEEAPYAYKPITPIINSIKDSGIARVVARLTPLCTVKG